LYKLEDLTAIILSLIILFTLFTSIDEIFHKPPAPNILVLVIQSTTIPLLALSVLSKYKAANILHSPSLKADAAHMFVDVIETSSVTLGLFLFLATHYGIIYTVSLIIALIGLLLAAYEAAHDSVLAILDLPKDKDFLKKLRNYLEKLIRGKAELVDLKARWAGPIVFVEILLRSHPLSTLESIGRLTRCIEENVRRKFEDVKYIVVMVEPTIRDYLKIAVPLEKPDPLSPVSEHFGRAPYFLIVDAKQEHIVNKQIISINDIVSRDLISREKTGIPMSLLRGAEIAENMHKLGVTDIIVRNIGEIAYSLLLRHKIVVWKARDSSAIENVEHLVKGYLEVMDQPTHEASWKKNL
ncbi:MAG: hypothetical protein GXO43_03585, partial [Crenarchaeota archaeon]|nr:hypothetical protein [Thermoproteota archaeon]